MPRPAIYGYHRASHSPARRLAFSLCRSPHLAISSFNSVRTSVAPSLLEKAVLRKAQSSLAQNFWGRDPCARGPDQINPVGQLVLFFGRRRKMFCQYPAAFLARDDKLSAISLNGK
jgi:hypothetical protein